MRCEVKGKRRCREDATDIAPDGWTQVCFRHRAYKPIPLGQLDLWLSAARQLRNRNMPPQHREELRLEFERLLDKERSLGRRLRRAEARQLPGPEDDQRFAEPYLDLDP